MRKRYIVTLTKAEREQLERLITAGTAAHKLMRARILLKADQGRAGPGWGDQAIAEALEVSPVTVARVRGQCVEEGLQAALNRRPPQREYRCKLDGAQEAHLIALPCSAPPEGQNRWRLRLLADKLVAVEVVEDLSYQTVRRVPQKNDLQPWRKKQWLIPPEATGEFVWRMEERLAVYPRPSAPTRPLVCLDEMPEPLLADVRAPIPMRAGQPVREDSEYDRRGMVNIFLGCEPRAGRRWVAVTDRRTKVDWAHPSKDLVDVRSPAADRIVLVLDNLNTHTPASLYETFPPAEAKRLADKLEIHYTPKHGSWLNIAEIELAILSRQCLGRRIPDKATLPAEVTAWAERRNAAGGKVDWRFTTEDARIKLKRLYPQIQRGTQH
ncbi:MAG: IS630 family transposase [Chloroflexota bacterium]